MLIYNTLIPALFLNVTVKTILPIGSGSLSTGGSLVLGHIASGTLVSEPGFETTINATISYADDWPVADPDGKHSRPDLRGLVSTDDGEYLQVAATGIQTPVKELGEIVTGGKGSLAFGSFQSGEWGGR
jgi:Protein of unknown function (DUF3237)